jgi:hypothetical protein
MRRAVASSLLLAVLVTLAIVCPCPPATAASMADDHSCCGKEGFRAAVSCCLTAADAPAPAALDAPPVAPPPLAVVVARAPVVAARRAPGGLRSPLPAPSPPSVLRI